MTNDADRPVDHPDALDHALNAESRTLRAIDLLLRGVPGARTDALPLGELLRREADALLAAHRAGHPAAAHLVRGDRHRPGTSAATDDELLAAPLSPDDALAALVRWHELSGWEDVAPRAHERVDPRFEAACDAIVDGDAAALRALLAADPALVHARSPFGHHQTLLQHVAANGIEASRQWRSPPNAVEIAELLLAAGADPDATCPTYGRSTALTLLVTSAHPAAAGLQAPLVEALCKHGAKPDGVDDDGAPLWSALSFGYTPAVDALVRCGARVDNLLFAAAAGDLAAVKACFDDAGRAIPDCAYSVGRAQILTRTPRTLDPTSFPEYALHWAVRHDRRAVADFLLDQQLDLSVEEPTWQSFAPDTSHE